MGTKILIAVLLAMLAGAVYIGYAGWTGHGDVELPTTAYVALALGLVFTLLVGSGLMILVFYSSRKGYDR